jgi:protein phosphatase
MAATAGATQKTGRRIRIKVGCAGLSLNQDTFFAAFSQTSIQTFSQAFGQALSHSWYIPKLMPSTDASRRFSLVAAGRTDIGRVRTHNEDAYLVAALGDGATVTKGVSATLRIDGSPALLVVADGVGGAASGEIASLMAADTILIEMRRQFDRGLLRNASAVEDAMRDAMAAANHVIFTYASGNPQHRGMATTATLAILYGSTLLLAQVGDSRAYLVREGTARQLTKDQSLVQRLIDAGEITEAQAALSDRRNIILQALGSEPVVYPDLYRETPVPGDMLLLCSDGLSNLVTDLDIARVTTEERDVGIVSDTLVQVANARGGHDNITVVTARFGIAGTTMEVPIVSTMQASTPPGLVGRVRRWLR